ncbi:MAG: choice-of-anchor J domain-containing protein [Muribaculaceae bacterium]|nr:choice-of-anchor J domain-containing protein [Muribaculaceae bacterium]
MKRFNLFLNALLLLLVAVGCNEDFDTPPMVVPHAEHQANMTIAEFKAKYWQDGRNFIDTCKDDTYIHGWVTSSDEEGNIYKHLYIQDETGGLGISIDANSICNTYRVGQEIVISMKDFWIGKYNGEYLIGKPEWYAAQSVWEAGRMSLDLFKEHTELEGLPNLDKIEPVEVQISDVVGHSDAETQLKYQGQFVIIRNVEWEGADGVLTYSETASSTTRNIKDEEGNVLGVNNSNYANFRGDPLPLGTGDVQGILYMTGSDKWGLYLRDTEDCMGFSNDTKGYPSDPWTVDEAIELQNQGKKGWVTGYIVGAIAPGVNEVTSNNDIEWGAPTTLDNTLVFASSADVRDFSRCIAVALPQGSSFRRDASLSAFPELLGTQIWVKGTLASFMGMAGITDNSGSTDEYKLSIMTGGVTELIEPFESSTIPDGWRIVKVQGDKDWYMSSFNDNGYIAVTGYTGKQPPFDAWLISPPLDIKNAGRKEMSFQTEVRYYRGTDMLEVYVMSTNDPNTAELVKLNPTLATADIGGQSDFVNSGTIDLSEFADGTYCIGFRYTSEQQSNYTTWQLDNFKFGGKALLQTIDDFETMNGGTPTSQSSFAELNSTKGWRAVNAGLLKGGTTDAPPIYSMIGKKADESDNWAYAVHLNGKLDGPQGSPMGVLYSPVITGGIKTLSFSYGYVLTDPGVSFTVYFYDMTSGNPVELTDKRINIHDPSATKLTAYNYTKELNINCDVMMKIQSDGVSNSVSNKDRFAIWNIVWEPN